jgi:hypothetical protein
MAAELIPDFLLASNNSETEDHLAKMGDSKETEAQASSPPSGTIAKLVSRLLLLSTCCFPTMVLQSTLADQVRPATFSMRHSTTSSMISLLKFIAMKKSLACAPRWLLPGRKPKKK